MDGSQNGYNVYMYNLSYSIHLTDFVLKLLVTTLYTKYDNLFISRHRPLLSVTPVSTLWYL